MQGTSFEATFAAGMGILGCILGACALIISLKDQSPATPVLVYDNADISKQAVAYIAAGHDPMAVIDEAIKRAVESGAIVISGKDVKAPEAALLQLHKFVAVGGDIAQLGEADAFAPEGVTPMSAETIAAQHAAQIGAQTEQPDNPQDN